MCHGSKALGTIDPHYGDKNDAYDALRTLGLILPPYKAAPIEMQLHVRRFFLPTVDFLCQYQNQCAKVFKQIVSL